MTYVYSGSFYAMDAKTRKIKWGQYEMVWPLDSTYSYGGFSNWREVDSSTVPANAYFVKNPYRMALKFWDDNRHERY